MAQEWLAENIKLPMEGSLRYQMEKRNIEEEQVMILSIFASRCINPSRRSDYRNRTKRKNRGFSTPGGWRMNSKSSYERTPSGSNAWNSNRYR